MAQNIKNKITGKEKAEGSEANLKFTAQIGSEDKTGESRFGIAFGKTSKKVIPDGVIPETDDSDEKTSKVPLTRQWFYSGLAVYVDKYIWVTKSEVGGKEALNTEDSFGEFEDETEDEIEDEIEPELTGGEYQKSSRVIDFCIFRAWDGERVPITKVPFSDKILF